MRDVIEVSKDYFYDFFLSAIIRWAYVLFVAKRL